MYSIQHHQWLVGAKRNQGIGFGDGMTISSPPSLLLSLLVNLLHFASPRPLHPVQASIAWVGGMMGTGGRPLAHICTY